MGGGIEAAKSRREFNVWVTEAPPGAGRKRVAVSCLACHGVVRSATVVNELAGNSVAERRMNRLPRFYAEVFGRRLVFDASRGEGQAGILQHCTALEVECSTVRQWATSRRELLARPGTLVDVGWSDMTRWGFIRRWRSF